MTGGEGQEEGMTKRQEEETKIRSDEPVALQRCSQGTGPQLSAPATSVATPWPPPWSRSSWDWDVCGSLCAWLGPGGSSQGPTPTANKSPSEGVPAPRPPRVRGRRLAGASPCRCHHQQRLHDVPGVGMATKPWPPSWASHGQASSSSPSRSRGTQVGSRKEERTLCRAPQGLCSPGLGGRGVAP